MFNPTPKNPFKIIFVILACGIIFPLYAQDTEKGGAANHGVILSRDVPEVKRETPVAVPDKKAALAEEASLSELGKQARDYRKQGLELQRRGDTVSALAYYQKAAELDPGYAVVFNDLGVIYESQDDIARAEEHYLKATKIDPKCASAYSNLAILYENRRDLKTAAIYWQKRAELGNPEDPWAQRAKARYNDIRLSLGEIPIDSPREQEVMDLVRDVSLNKELLKRDDKELAKSHFEKAKVLFDKYQLEEALKEALEAQHLNPACEGINEFIEKVQTRILSR